MRQFLVAGVDDLQIGEVEVTTEDDEVILDKVRALTLSVANVETAESEQILLVVPTSAGPQLLRSLLTDAQYEAAILHLGLTMLPRSLLRPSNTRSTPIHCRIALVHGTTEVAQ